MNIKLSKICEIGVLFATLLMLRVDLFFVSIENSSSNTLYYIVIIIGLLLLLLVKAFGKDRYRFAKSYTFITLFICLFFGFYTIKLYGYSWYEVFTIAFTFLFLLFSIPIAYILDTSRKMAFIRHFIQLNYIFLIVRFIAWFTYNYTNIHIFENFATRYSNWNRSGFQRVDGGATFAIVSILMIALMFYIGKKNNQCNIYKYRRLIIIGFCFLAFYAIAVMRTRWAIASVFITIVSVYYFTGRKAITKLGIVFLVIIAILIVIFSGFIDSTRSLMSSFSISQQVVYTGYLGSIQARTLGIQHFWDLFKSTGKGVGLGFIANAYGTEKMFMWTSWQDFYLADLGILAGFFRFGVFAFIIYGWLFAKAVKVTRKAKKLNSPYTNIMISLTTFMIMYCILQNLYDYQTAFCAPFFVGIISFVDEDNKRVLAIDK